MTHASLPSESQQFLRFAYRGRQRPFTVHILAGRDDAPHCLRMLRSRVQHYHEVNVGTLDKGVDRGLNPPNPIVACRRFGGVAPMAEHRVERVLRQQVEHAQVPVLCPVSDANDAHTQRRNPRRFHVVPVLHKRSQVVSWGGPMPNARSASAAEHPGDRTIHNPRVPANLQVRHIRHAATSIPRD